MITFETYLNTLRQKGYLAYEYNPFHNYLTDVDLYLVDNKYVVPAGQAVNTKNGELLTKKIIENELKWIDKRGNIITENVNKAEDNSIIYATAGSLIDLDTDLLNFDLEHPVDIQVLPSYDGSVNLILNDNKNIPRLINSRFSAREKNTYEIVDRIGENDTNIYNSSKFDKDTSLYFLYEDNPTISYLGFVKGNLQVGQYCFYFTYCDSDDNESDYIAESGLIPVFIGSDCDPNSIDGGIKNQDSNKGIRLRLLNVDKSYNYLKIYYVRYFADYLQNRVYEAKKIYLRYPINSNTLYIQITGQEQSEDIDANILNISRFNPKSVLTSAQCKNMLFFGNIVKNTDNYKELQDCALRIIPKITSNTLQTVSTQYTCNDSKFGYYSSINYYDKVGYFNLEYYRFGVVFIYLNGTLSNVYNTLGGTLDDTLNITNQELFTTNGAIAVRNYIKIDDNGWVKDGDGYELSGNNINARGVCRLLKQTVEDHEVLGIKFEIPQEVVNYLKSDLGIRGLFFVRQKCVPNILAQTYILPMDEQLEAPVIKYDDNKYITECFVSQSSKNDTGGRLVTNEYSSRLYEYKYTEKNNTENSISKKAYAGICPDFLLNLPYYNQIFNGSKFRLEPVSDKLTLSRNGRIYSTNEFKSKSDKGTILCKICTVTEDVPTVAIEDKVYRLEIGETEESYKFKYCEIDSGTYTAGDEDWNSINKATNVVRGKYSPYLAIYSDMLLETNVLYNIYVESSVDITQEYKNRMDSHEPFYAISDRYNFDKLTNSENIKSLICYRGDCFINTFTYRLNRNFNDPSLPNNDVIIDTNTWKDNYKANDPTKWENISRSDLNAVQMGSWITFKVRSAMNYAFRSQDHSFVSEEALMGAPRSYYPRNKMMWRGENKMPDSYLFNDAYRASLGFKCYFALQDINYIKNTFSNRILYSAISILDSFKNNYRESLSTYFRDYSQEYGGITKLVDYEGNLLVIFEHAIGIAVVNERILAGQGDGNPVFINTENVLPEELTIITDTYGTLWTESVIKSEQGYVYGVDTIAKKIWRVKGQQLELLSDFKVNKFLIDNISLSERELYPIIGLKNVKTHYNNNKKDVMFTFYDDVYKDEEKVWNLCYNEILGEFVTFYSWLPSYSENIDTQFFTFDRNTSKYLALLAKCNYSIPENTGVLLNPPILKYNSESKSFITLPALHYIQSDYSKYTLLNPDGTTIEANLNSNNLYEIKEIKFRLEKDHWNNNKLFNIEENDLYIDVDMLELKQAFDKLKVILLYITPYLLGKDQLTEINSEITFKTELIAITADYIINNPLLTTKDKQNAGLTTDFYLHGQAGIFDIKENVYPTHWYGKYHPFEFEFVVNDKVAQLKIFTNLLLISNKAEPESFHFEIEGDNYEFSSDKRAMYFRQEATKELYLNMGSDMLFDRKYTDVIADKYTYEQYYRQGEMNSSNEYQNQYNKFDRVYPKEVQGLVLSVKSTIFPLYYEKVDTYNDIYHKYKEMLGVGYDFKNLSGSEITWNRDLNQFNIVTHIKNNPIDKVGVMRGNSRYKEGKWNILIPSISLMLKNEDKWPSAEYNENGKLDNRIPKGSSYAGSNINVPPIVINSGYIPKDLTTDEITVDKLPNIYTRTKTENEEFEDWTKYVSASNWTYRKEALIRDKWIKIRIRYSGKNLAIIHSLVTLYNLSTS